MTDFWTTADEIHAPPGAYVLAINLSELVAVSIYRKPSVLLAPGCYLYCDLAKGPGGLAARLARHMRHGKAEARGLFAGADCRATGLDAG